MAILLPPLKNTVFIQLLRSKLLLLLVLTVCCTPPEDPIKCSSSQNSNCTITNSYGVFPDRSICRAAKVVFPTTEEELISVVSTAAMAKTKMKVVTHSSHSIPKLVCVDGKDGLLISTKYLNKTLKIDKESMTMTVQSGVMLKQIIEDAAEAGLALPYAPYWWGLTIGGMLGTGAHGSTLWGKGSSVHDYVVEMRIVSPAGVRVLDQDHHSHDLNAARVSLGVLGVVSQVTLKLESLFKRSITYLTKDDEDLGDKVGEFGRQHEFADIIWYPSQRKVVYRLDDRAPSNATANGAYDFIPFQPTLSALLAAIRITEETQEALRDATGKCINGQLTTFTLQTTAYGLTNNGIIFTGYPVIGNHNRVQASGSCLNSLQDSLITACSWDPRIKGEFFHQSAFSVSLSMAKSFIQDVQKLVDLEPKALCGLDLYNGILMRYITASSAYLGKEEDAIDFDITYYRSKDSMTPRLHEDILEEIEQMALFKYGALPHWGKNRNLAFIGAINKYKNATQFLNVKDTYDPNGLFSNEWTDQILGLRDGVTILKKGCALEGLCICSQDFHCAPDKGYVCSPGKVYKDARVCARKSNN